MRIKGKSFFYRLDPVSYTHLDVYKRQYESKLETYVNDQFLLRNAFIKIKATADVTAGKLESNGVYRCKDNYLMEELTVPSDKLLENTLSSLKQFKRQYKKLDAFFLLAPNAGNILEEKLPNFTRLNDQDQSMDKFFKEIKRYGYTPIDVRDTFAKHTEDTQIYYRTFLSLIHICPIRP